MSSIVSSLEIDVEGHFADIGWAISDEFNNTFVRQDLYKCFIGIAGSDAGLDNASCDIQKIKNASK